jgi:diadenosine tetraphosphate (Ap4A) HIT family hydrolase
MTSPADAFALDPRLDLATMPVAGLGLSDLQLMNDSRFPWLLLVPRRVGAVEIVDMEKPDRAALFEEIMAVSAALRTVTGCDKLNIAALGNAVPQLHVHVIARFWSDPAWPGPGWGAGEAVAYEDDEGDRLAAAIRAALAA